MLFFYFILLFTRIALSEDNEISDKLLYVAKSKVIMNETIGTSRTLNVLLSNNSARTRELRKRLDRNIAPGIFYKKIHVYDENNLRFMPTKESCNYKDPINCGIINNHLTLMTTVVVGDKYTIISFMLYDQKGNMIGRSSKTAWGTIRVKPQWKKTTVSKQSQFGPSKMQILEQWPSKIEELPPLIRPHHISQGIITLYLSVDTQ